MARGGDKCLLCELSRSICSSPSLQLFSRQYAAPIPKTGVIQPTLMMEERNKWRRGREDFGSFSSRAYQIATRRKTKDIKLQRQNVLQIYVKKANLSARKKERIKLPNYANGYGGKIHHISEFLSHQSGVEAILNKNALQNLQRIDSNTYRCTLLGIQLLNFEVSPVLDLRVIPTGEDCTVDMLSCKFEGSEVVERQNNKFSASMRNHITWDTNDAEQFLDVDVKLNLSLEIYTQPFSLLPTSAVEGPGNIASTYNPI